jgi:hypothetical protein
MTPKFVLLYGLPGAGKTTLCDTISKIRDDVVYCNIGSHPQFNKIPIEKVIGELVGEYDNSPVHIVIEGCFPNRTMRQRILKLFAGKRKGVMVHVKESLETLSTRRVRSVDEYQKLQDKIQFTKNCVILDKPDLDDRVHALDEIIGEPAKLTKYIVLSRSRSGSNFLTSYLNSHPLIVCHGESAKNLSDTDNGVKVVRHHLRSKKQCTGFKIFYYHAKNKPEVWAYLQGDKDIKVIHLIRENSLAMMVSRKLMGMGGPNRIKEPTKRDHTTNLELTVSECQKWFDQCELFKAEAVKKFAHHDVLTVTYEDLISDASIQRQIQEFLGVKYRSLDTDMVKQQVRPLSSVITNFDQLKTYFTGTPYEKYFL